MSFQKLINETWRIAVYYIKFSVFVFWMLTTILVIPLMFRKPGHYNNKLTLLYYSDLISKIMGIKWTLKGKENIIIDSGSVVVVNHQSMIDALATKPLAKHKVFTHSVIKREVWYVFPFAIALWLTGSIFINRSKKTESLQLMNSLCQEIVKDKKKLLVFPEGTRNDCDGFLPFKKGAFHTAISAQVPVQPVVIGKYKFLDHKKHRFDAGEAVVSILPPIPTTGLKTEDVNSLIQKTTEIMQKEFKALNKSD